jgi:XRE family transcriptional regulator, aerobic/anaerobic benzoate catabolism transcriptional regulator
MVGKTTKERARPVAREPDPLLTRLGERVRNLRAIRGMTRKALARDAGVSERFLADLETGVGNASILLLNRLAAALAFPIQELIATHNQSQPDLSLSMQLLSKLSEDDLEEARRLLQGRFTPPGDTTLRRSRIALIGLRGAGKSTLGRILAQTLSYPFVELDQRIEELSGMDTAQIHMMLEQSVYRRYEFDALESLVNGKHEGLVIATPGSIVSETQTYSYLLRTCFTVWIKASPEEHMTRVVAQGDMRPMAGNREAMNDLRRILVNREPLYAKADATVDTSHRPVSQSFDALRRAIQPPTL